MKKIILLLILTSLLLSACGTKEDKSTLTDMENYLMNHGLLEGEKIEPMAIMIGALEGFKYIDSNIEVYMYDIKSEEYKDLAKKKSVTLEGFGVEMPVAAINGKFVLFYTGDDESVVKIFKEFDHRDAPVLLTKKEDITQDQIEENPTPDTEDITHQVIEHSFASEAATSMPDTEHESTIESKPELTITPEPTPILTRTPESTPTPKPTNKPTPVITEEEDYSDWLFDVSEDDYYEDNVDYYILDLDDAAALAERNFLDYFGDVEYEIVDEEDSTYNADIEDITEQINKMIKYGFATSESMESEFGKAYMEFCDAWISERELKNTYLISVVQSISDNKLHLIIDTSNKYIIDAPPKLENGVIYTDGKVQYQYLDKFEYGGESRSLNQIYFNRDDLLRQGILD